MAHTETHDTHGGMHDWHQSPLKMFVLPILIPVLAGLALLGIILAVSQILLALGHNATPVALLIALIILVLGGVFASAPRLSRVQAITAVVVPALILAAAGIGARVYRVNHHEAKTEQTAAIPPEVTTDNKFSVTSYTVPANTPIDIPVRNAGQAIHNMHILDVKDANTGGDIKTDLLQPGQSADLKFVIAQPGTYKFQCDVHPTEMVGQIVVTPAKEGAGGGQAAGASGAAATTITMTDNKFSQTTITIEHGQKVTLNFDNKGQAIHNWDLLGQKDPSGNDLKTALLQPGQTASLTFQIDQPGQYKFQCDVHPTEMVGTLVVK